MNGLNRSVTVSRNGRTFNVSPVALMGPSDVPAALTAGMSPDDASRAQLAYLFGGIKPMGEYVTIIIAAVSAAIKIYSSWKQKKIAQAQAHKEFMDVVYTIPGIGPYTQQLHRAAETSLELAAWFLEKVVSPRLIKEEQDRLAAQTAAATAAAAAAAGIPTLDKNKAIDVSRKITRELVAEGIAPDPQVVADRAIMATVDNRVGEISPQGIRGWWLTSSTGEKALAIASTVGLAYGGYKLYKRSNP